VNDLTHLQSQLANDPYPLYRLLRSEGRVHWSDLPRGWLVPHYADVVDVLRDPRLGAHQGEGHGGNRLRISPALEQQYRRTLFYMDPPAHTELRDRVRHAFTPRKTARLRGRIEAIANELIDAALPSGRIELIADFAYPLPVLVIAELLGIAARDLPLLKRWSDELAVLLVEPFKTQDDVDRCDQSLVEMRRYFEAVFEERRAEPREDLVSQLVSPEGGGLDEDDLFALVSLILVAGHETTTNLIGNSVLALLRDPAAKSFLEADPARVHGVVDELLRFDSPVQVAQRVAKEDCVVAGQEVKRGDRLYAMLGSANRDEAAFSDPDRLDFGRGDVRHVAFGQGVHFCLGASLARLEGGVAIETLLRRLPALKADFETPVWRQRVVLRGLQSLPLRF
jgi:pimeloyl-[acyl-carrier protein] synthase